MGDNGMHYYHEQAIANSAQKMANSSIPVYITCTVAKADAFRLQVFSADIFVDSGHRGTFAIPGRKAGDVAGRQRAPGSTTDYKFRRERLQAVLVARSRLI